MIYKRRNVLLGLGAGLGLLGMGLKAQEAWASEGPYELPPLPYGYGDLEPYISEETLRLHHDKHHAGYVRQLNLATAQYPDLQRKTAEELLLILERLPQEIRTAVRHHGGGHANHTMFWQIMAPPQSTEPQGPVVDAITKIFGDLHTFQAQFNAAGLGQFGSGWVWLVRSTEGGLKIRTTPNQDSPITQGEYPILGNDVWEHAYYLTYQNRRGDYLKDWWHLVNWHEVNRRFSQGGLA